jgi:hypothetical protein
MSEMRKIGRVDQTLSFALPKAPILPFAAIRVGLVLSLPDFLTACSRNPSVEFSGSFFPAWMISIFLAVIVALRTGCGWRSGFP